MRVEAALGGSYTGIFPMGLLASLKPAPHESPSLRLYRRDTSLPWKVYNYYSYLLTLHYICDIKVFRFNYVYVTKTSFLTTTDLLNL